MQSSTHQAAPSMLQESTRSHCTSEPRLNDTETPPQRRRVGSQRRPAHTQSNYGFHVSACILIFYVVRVRVRVRVCAGMDWNLIMPARHSSPVVGGGISN